MKKAIMVIFALLCVGCSDGVCWGKHYEECIISCHSSLKVDECLCHCDRFNRSCIKFYGKACKK
jgi:hypothetical protein